MSLDQPARNKAIQTPPAKKGFHFPSDGIHFAEFIEAATLEEAEAIYHTVKRPMTAPDPVSQSTPVTEPGEDTNG